jgi:hypothetical protein
VPFGVLVEIITRVAPAPPNPAVESLEELADVGAFVILTPAPQERIKSRDQFLGFQRCRPFSPLPHLVHETTNGLLLGIRIERILLGLTTNLTLGQMKPSVPALDFVAKEFEAVPDVNNPRFCGCSSTPGCFRMRRAASSAARASAADL